MGGDETDDCVMRLTNADTPAYQPTCGITLIHMSVLAAWPSTCHAHEPVSRFDAKAVHSRTRLTSCTRQSQSPAMTSWVCNGMFSIPASCQQRASDFIVSLSSAAILSCPQSPKSEA